MATKEELVAAVKTIKEHCLFSKCRSCELYRFCFGQTMLDTPWPYEWPDPEGGDEDV